MNSMMHFESPTKLQAELPARLVRPNSSYLTRFARAVLGVTAAMLAVIQPLAVKAELIPAARLVDWTAGVSVGVPGGIPTNRTKLINVTLSPYNADYTGTSDASPAIQAAINAASSEDIVYLPAGRYLINSTLNIGPSKDSITVRGAGMDSTILDVRVNTAFNVGSGSDYQWAWPMAGNNISAGLTKGSTEITVADTSAFSAGQIIQIAVENQSDTAAIAAGATPIVSVGGYPYLRRQLSRVTGKTSSTLKIFPPVHYTPDAGLKARVNVAQFQTDFVGIENMTIDGTNGQMVFPIMFQQCYGSWISGIKIINTKNYGFFFTDSLNCEARKSIIRDRKVGGSNGAGALLGHVGNSLIEDNIIVGIFPAVEVNTSSTGNVVAYNLLENAVGGTLNTNHAPHNSFNLYEGNITPNMQADGYFGSASDDTFFRNWMHGTDRTLTLRTFITSLNRFTRNYSLVGNIFGEAGTTGTSPYSFGNPNMGNSMYTNTARPTQNRFWRDWGATGSVTSRSSDSAGTVQLNGGGVFVGQLVILRWENDTNLHRIISVSSVNGNSISWSNGTGTPIPPAGTAVKVYFESGGYQELDEDVGATTLLKANYFFGTRSIPANESLGNDSLPASLFRTSKPEWFGTLAWPPFDPFNPAPSFTSIPAGFRYINSGSEPPAGVASLPTNVRIRRQ
jgi:hypothetical protein